MGQVKGPGSHRTITGLVRLLLSQEIPQTKVLQHAIKFMQTEHTKNSLAKGTLHQGGAKRKRSQYISRIIIIYAFARGAKTFKGVLKAKENHGNNHKDILEETHREHNEQ